MVNKFAVFGCKRGYESEEPQHEDYHAFYFPLDERKSHLLPAWEKFVCRDGWKPSANSVICEFHFEDRLIRKGKRWTLKWKLNPMPTMLTDEMKAMPQSVQPTPAAPPRKPSRKLLNKMLDISNYQAKGRPPYSSAMIRFALHLRYTSLQSYKLLLEKFPLPSISTHGLIN